MLIPASVLAKEADLVEGFAPERLLAAEQKIRLLIGQQFGNASPFGFEGGTYPGATGTCPTTDRRPDRTEAPSG